MIILKFQRCTKSARAPTKGIFPEHRLRVLKNGRLCDQTRVPRRSEEHTSELQSLRHLVCRLLLEKKKRKIAAINGSVRAFVIRRYHYALNLSKSHKVRCPDYAKQGTRRQPFHHAEKHHSLHR